MSETHLSLFEVLQSLFPQTVADDEPYSQWPGHEELPREHDGGSALARELRYHYAMPPLSPFDLFAICGHLLEISGAYHHVVPALPENAPGRPVRRVLHLTREELEQCQLLAETWREDIWKPGEEVDEESFEKRFAERRNELWPLVAMWDELFGKYGGARAFASLPETVDPPGWWKLALKLFVIADEAARHVGYATLQESAVGLPWFEGPITSDLKERLNVGAGFRGSDEADQELEVESWLHTLSFARPDIVCVLPKARTTAVGCTMRSLSHHLALLPARGIARANWVPQIVQHAGVREWEFNILLVPFPFSMRDHNFRGRLRQAPTGSRWGFFEVEQTWLDPGDNGRRDIAGELVSFVTALVEDAMGPRHRAPSIDAIAFPELALSYGVFRAFRERLRKHLPGLELIIAGLSDNDTGRRGNFVGVSLGYGPGLETIREKHHRWHLNEQQIKSYKLQGVLNHTLDWWEDIDLLSRRVDFTVVRRNSVLAAMICEDLARVDPCQELLRAVGPNIVVALLMDAPQLPSRWPARYATILSEDPGSSVLTLTSRALMTWQHHNVAGFTSRGDDDRIIGLWRDADVGGPVPIICPNDAHGVWLRLWGKPVRDMSLDGREDATSIAWLFASQSPLRVPDASMRFGALLGEEDVALRNKAGNAFKAFC